MRRVEVDMRSRGDWTIETVDSGSAYVLGHLIALDAIYERTELAED